jgi:hypothetical protein
MENSVFETFSDKQLIKYMKYAMQFIDINYNDLQNFYWGLEGTVELKQISAPVGRALGRLDIEYIYYLIINNENFEGEGINRPKLEEMEIRFNTKERQIVYTTHTGELLTYVPDDVDQSYLYFLKDNEEIHPWDWESDTDYGDSDYIDDEFEY